MWTNNYKYLRIKWLIHNVICWIFPETVQKVEFHALVWHFLCGILGEGGYTLRIWNLESLIVCKGNLVSQIRRDTWNNFQDWFVNIATFVAYWHNLLTSTLSNYMLTYGKLLCSVHQTERVGGLITVTNGLTRGWYTD